MIVACDDPGGLSSVTERESRFLARFLEIPLLAPASFQEAKDMTRWAFELSEEVRNVVLLRSVTCMSYASGNVILGDLPEVTRRAAFRYDGPIQDPDTGLALTFFPVSPRHRLQQEKLDRAREIFKTSPFNVYEGWAGTPRRAKPVLTKSSAPGAECAASSVRQGPLYGRCADMGPLPIPADPFNLIITGVGGQGNAMASRTMARMLVKQGFHMTIKETFSMSQRGGSA